MAAEGEQGGERKEVRVERPGTGKACRALKVIKVERLSSPGLQASPILSEVE